MISKTFMICDAYEAGYGKGQQLRETVNPYLETTECHEAWQLGYDLGKKRAKEAYKEDMLKNKVKPEDPCPGCTKGHVCRTPACGRLKLPLDHPLRNSK